MKGGEFDIIDNQKLHKTKLSIGSRNLIDLNDRSTRLEKEHGATEGDEERSRGEHQLAHRDVNAKGWLAEEADLATRKLQPCKSEVAKHSGTGMV